MQAVVVVAMVENSTLWFGYRLSSLLLYYTQYIMIIILNLVTQFLFLIFCDSTQVTSSAEKKSKK